MITKVGESDERQGSFISSSLIQWSWAPSQLFGNEILGVQSDSICCWYSVMTEENSRKTSDTVSDLLDGILVVREL